FYEAMNQPAKAEEAWRKAAETWEQLTAKPDVNVNTFRSRHFRSQQASMHYKLGSLCLRAGRKEQAEAECSKAVTLREKLVREAQKDVSERPVLALFLSTASIAYEANGHSDQAVAAVGKSLAIWEKLAQENEGTLEYRQEEADCHSRLGDLHSKADRREQ